MDQTYSRGRLSIISCDSGMHFAEKVVKSLDNIIECEAKNSEVENQGALAFRKTEEMHFANTEVKIEIGESIRGNDIYIFQDVENHIGGMSVNDNVAALKSAIDAARRSGVQFITAVIPVFPYARQDKANAREGITASSFARDIEDLGASGIMTLDIHNTAIAGFFRKAVFDNLKASKQIMKYARENMDVDNLVVVAADVGGAARAKYFAETLGTKLAILYKERDYSHVNKVEKMTLLGRVRGKEVLVVEDIIDTAGTVKLASLTLDKKGAEKIFFSASLPMFNGSALEKLDELYAEGIIKKVIGTNVIYKPEGFSENHPWYAEVSMENYFANVIYNINRGKSISKLLD